MKLGLDMVTIANDSMLAVQTITITRRNVNMLEVGLMIRGVNDTGV